MLASPWPTNSWLLSSRWPVCAASERAIAEASTSPIAAIASAPVESSPIRPRSSSGRRASGGRLCGSAPMISTPRRSRLRPHTSAPAATRLISGPGSLRFSQRRPTSIATVAAPRIRLGR